MTTTYLDIGAVRVQSYLGRWPSLAGRRAGSALLQQHLSADSPGLQHQLQGRARKNTDAGTVDSVLSVTVEDGVNPEVLARDRHTCRRWGCGRTRGLELHHLVPRARGGGNATASAQYDSNCK